MFPFQYSLRIVGFRDNGISANHLALYNSFSIPCESWGSATRNLWPEMRRIINFQYSLRIVGFRDDSRRLAFTFCEKHFQYSLRIVGFRDSTGTRGHSFRLSFQYSLRIVGFRDFHQDGQT